MSDETVYNNIDVSNNINDTIDLVEDDTILYAEFKNSVLETHETIIIEENITADYANVTEIIDNVDETSDDGYTNDNISVYTQESFLFSSFSLNLSINELIEEVFICNITFNKFNLNNFELKNNDLFNLEFSINLKIPAKIITIENINYNNKTHGNYAYSIDNSIIGDDTGVCFISILFKFNSCFDTYFVKGTILSDFILLSAFTGAQDTFCNMLVEICKFDSLPH